MPVAEHSEAVDVAIGLVARANRTAFAEAKEQPESTSKARAQLMLRTRNVCLLAGSFAEAGFFPASDHVVADREMLEAMLGWLQPRPVCFVTLAPDLSTARARNATRPERERIDYDISGLYADIQREFSART